MAAKEEPCPMKALIIGAVAAIALLVAIGGRGGDSEEDTNLEQGVHQFDGYLQKGLSPTTHDAISRRAEASRDWFQSFEERALNVAK
jgi:hypothetical protein